MGVDAIRTDCSVYARNMEKLGQPRFRVPQRPHFMFVDWNKCHRTAKIRQLSTLHLPKYLL